MGCICRQHYCEMQKPCRPTYSIVAEQITHPDTATHIHTHTEDALAKRGADSYSVVKHVRNHCLVAERKRRVNQYVAFRGDSVALRLLRLQQEDIRIQTGHG